MRQTSSPAGGEWSVAGSPPSDLRGGRQTGVKSCDDEERNESDRLIRASRQLQAIAAAFGEVFSDEDTAVYHQRQRIFVTIIEAPDFDGLCLQVEIGGVAWVKAAKQQLGYKMTGGLTDVTSVGLNNNFVGGGRLDNFNTFSRIPNPVGYHYDQVKNPPAESLAFKAAC